MGSPVLIYMSHINNNNLCCMGCLLHIFVHRIFSKETAHSVLRGKMASRFPRACLLCLRVAVLWSSVVEWDCPLNSAHCEPFGQAWGKGITTILRYPFSCFSWFPQLIHQLIPQVHCQMLQDMLFLTPPRRCHLLQSPACSLWLCCVHTQGLSHGFEPWSLKPD